MHDCRLQFHFYTGTGAHSVVSSTFESPCIPATNAFFSGYVAGTSSGSIIFTTNVTSTDPIWFYCSLSTHCQGGMIGVVNPPTGKSAADYANAAKSAAKASAPASVQGGVLATAAFNPGRECCNDIAKLKWECHGEGHSYIDRKRRECVKQCDNECGEHGGND